CQAIDSPFLFGAQAHGLEDFLRKRTVVRRIGCSERGEDEGIERHGVPWGPGVLPRNRLARKSRLTRERRKIRSRPNMIYPNTGLRVAALNLEILSRGLAAIGDLFVFDRLSFIEGGKTCLLHRRDMNKHVLAARRGLDEPVPFGRVEPLDRTFSHTSVSTGSINQNERPIPANRLVRSNRIRWLRRP